MEGRRHQEPHKQNQTRLQHIATYMEINSPLTSQQDLHFQHKREVSSTRWFRDMAGNQDQHPQAPDFYQHSDASRISLPVTSGGQKSSQMNVCGKGQDRSQ